MERRERWVTRKKIVLDLSYMSIEGNKRTTAHTSLIKIDVNDKKIR
jgi:hypothetical protein